MNEKVRTLFPSTIDRVATLRVFQPLHRWIGASERVQIPILMYHSVSNDPDQKAHPYYWTTTSPRIFAQQMKFLSENGYSVIPLREAAQRIHHQVADETSSYAKQVVITFDDGFDDIYTHAVPIMQEYGFTASVFLPTKYIGNSTLPFKGKKCLDWDQVRELFRAGITFGSHTVSHPQLSELSPSERLMEVRRSKEVLEDELGAPIDSFSYPYAFPEQDGEFVRRLHLLLEDSGFTHGVSTVLGLASSKDDLFFLRRLPVSSRDDNHFLRAKLEGAYNWLHSFQYATKLIKNMGAGRSQS